MRSLVIALTLTAFAVNAAEAIKNPDLEKAQKALAAKKYPEALKLIDSAEKKGGLDLDSYSTLLETKALALASTKKVDAATAEFKKLLALDPRRDLSGKYKGDVETALEAALAWVQQAGGLQVVALEPGVQGGKVKQVSVSIKNDPLKMAKAARIYLKQDGGTWKPIDVALNNGVAAADTDGAEVTFWAELQDEKKNQLKFLGSAIRPVTQSAPAAVAEAAKPAPAAAKPADKPVVAEETKLTPTATAEPVDAVVTDEAPKKTSILRPVSYALLGAGLITAGVGVYFGVTSEGQKSQIRMDQMSGNFSQQQLFDRDQSRLGQARAANAMFISAGILAAIGVVMFILGG